MFDELGALRFEHPLWRPTPMALDVYETGYTIGDKPVHVFADARAVYVRVEGHPAVRVERRPRELEVTSQGGLAIPFQDSITIHSALNERCRGETHFDFLRLRAVVLLMWSGALRVSECLALDVAQIIEARDGKMYVKSSCVLRAEQRGDRHELRRSEPHEFPIDREAKAALVAYIIAAKKKGWLRGWTGPLFIASRGVRGARGHERWSKRALETAWCAKRATMKLDREYELRDVRHDAILRRPGSVEERASFGRVSRRSITTSYSHPDPDGFREMREAVVEAVERLTNEIGGIKRVNDAGEQIVSAMINSPHAIKTYDVTSLRDLHPGQHTGSTVPPTVPRPPKGR